MPRPVLECRGLHKSYDDRLIVDEVSFEVGEGEIVGLLGPNGAGKTTLLRAILDLVPADGGEVLLDGLPLRGEHRNNLGYLPEERALPPDSRIDELLTYLLRLRGLSQAAAQAAVREGLSELGFDDYLKKPVSALSKGMLGRVTFLAATAHRPRLLVLDEPYSGLDPVGAQWMDASIRRCRDRGSSILMSAHQMHLVERLCDRIIMLHGGRRVLYGTLEEVRQIYPADRICVTLRDPALALEAMLPYPTRRLGPGAFEIAASREQGVEILQDLLRREVVVESFTPVSRTLEEVFLEVVGSSPALEAVLRTGGHTPPDAEEPFA